MHFWFWIKISCHNELSGYLYINFAQQRAWRGSRKRLRWGIIISDDKQWVCRPLLLPAHDDRGRVTCPVVSLPGRSEGARVCHTKWNGFSLCYNFNFCVDTYTYFQVKSEMSSIYFWINIFPNIDSVIVCR